MAGIYGGCRCIYGRLDVEGSRYAWVALGCAIVAVLVDDWWPRREKGSDRG